MLPRWTGGPVVGYPRATEALDEFEQQRAYQFGQLGTGIRAGLRPSASEVGRTDLI
ncbi:hypothetical protein [Saccharothrix sp. ALI-22-I]|uniref:hypothetical protein n=1 Tax=Saccharothrix sp. ALI-22-I TaxID=1933778 RepID=UPI0015C3768F|nr:hypothetical protein [Saccharothrix sp. ALI-22-I]